MDEFVEIWLEGESAHSLLDYALDLSRDYYEIVTSDGSQVRLAGRACTSMKLTYMALTENTKLGDLYSAGTTINVAMFDDPSVISALAVVTESSLVRECGALDIITYRLKFLGSFGPFQCD